MTTMNRISAGGRPHGCRKTMPRTPRAIPTTLRSPHLKSALRVKRIDVQPLTARLATSFGIASDVSSKSMRTENVLVILETQDGVRGFGEAAPFAGIAGDSHQLLRDDIGRVQTRLRNAVLTVFEAEELLRRELLYPAAQAGVEMALWDALAKQHGIPLAHLLNEGSERLPLVTDITIPIGEVHDLDERVVRYRDEGFRRVKIKVGDGIEPSLARVRAVHRTYHAAERGFEILIDANEGFCAGDAMSLLGMLALFGGAEELRIFEQPVARDDVTSLHGMRRELANVGADIYADESVFTIDDARHLVDRGAVDGINLKLMKHGGLVEAMRIAELALENGLGLMIGGMIETRLAMTAALHLATAIGCWRFDWADLDTPLLMSGCGMAGGIAYERDVMTLPEGPGIGVTPVAFRAWR